MGVALLTASYGLIWNSATMESLLRQQVSAITQQRCMVNKDPLSVVSYKTCKWPKWSLCCCSCWTSIVYSCS